MGAFRLLTLGLWFGLIFIVLMALGDVIVPGQLAETAFTEMGLLSIFAMLICDSFFTVGSME